MGAATVFVTVFRFGLFRDDKELERYDGVMGLLIKRGRDRSLPRQ